MFPFVVVKFVINMWQIISKVSPNEITLSVFRNEKTHFNKGIFLAKLMYFFREITSKLCIYRHQRTLIKASKIKGRLFRLGGAEGRSSDDDDVRKFIHGAEADGSAVSHLKTWRLINPSVFTAAPHLVPSAVLGDPVPSDPFCPEVQ